MFCERGLYMVRFDNSEIHNRICLDKLCATHSRDAIQCGYAGCVECFPAPVFGLDTCLSHVVEQSETRDVVVVQEIGVS